MKLTERERRHLLAHLSEWSFTDDLYGEEWRQDLTDADLLRFINSSSFGYEGGYEKFKLDYAHLD